MIPVACVACGAQTSPRFAENIDESKISSQTFSSRKRPELMHHTYYECHECKTLCTDGVDVGDLAARYRDSVHESITESEFAARTYVRLLLKHGGHVPRTALDVGCSDGTFLHQLAQKGVVRVVGIEPSHDAARQGHHPDVEIFIGSLEDFASTETFEAVFLLQTIEHIPQPSVVLKELMSRVSSGGALYIVCHNRLSLVNRVLGRRSPIFDIEHLQIFTKKGIKSLVLREGYRAEKVRSFANRYPLSYALRLGLPRLSENAFVDRSFRVIDPTIPFPVGNLFVVVRH